MKKHTRRAVGGYAFSFFKAGYRSDLYPLRPKGAWLKIFKQKQ
jgi:hypothetical protein